MAEQLIIRVKVDGMGEGRGGSGGGNSITAGAAGAVISNGMTPIKKDRQNLRQEILKAEQEMTGRAYNPKGRTVGRIEQPQFLGIKNGKAAYRIDYTDKDTGGILGSYDFNYDAEDPLANALEVESKRNIQRVKAMASAAAWKTVSSASSIYQHRSNNSYANAKLNNSIKLAGYGAAVAVAGPAAIPFIVGNELANAIVSVSNYNWDRRTEQKQINNIKTIAGNINYGRNRGAY